MSAERLSPERLAEIREMPEWWPLTSVRRDLLAHIDAQQAEIDRLEGQVAALREGLEHMASLVQHGPGEWIDTCCQAAIEPVLASTEAAAKAHDQRERLAGAREFAAYIDVHSDQMGRRYLITALEDWMEREAGQ